MDSLSNVSASFALVRDTIEEEMLCADSRTSRGWHSKIGHAHISPSCHLARAHQGGALEFPLHKQRQHPMKTILPPLVINLDSITLLDRISNLNNRALVR